MGDLHPGVEHGTGPRLSCVYGHWLDSAHQLCGAGAVS